MQAPVPRPAAELRASLAGALDGLPPRQAAAATARLMEHYRGRTPTRAPVLRDAADAAAYAAYRMPATFGAVRAALAAFRLRAGPWAPTVHTDLGGGTGAATWAVADAWPDGRHRSTVLDWSRPALDLGRTLAAGACHPGVLEADWRYAAVGGGLTLPDVDLVTVSYVLGELPSAGRRAVIAAAARAARAVLVVEPGTPAGHERVLQARRQVAEAGFTVLAPCPHDAGCPIAGAGDWCHFAARISRSALHRQVKGGSLPYEDEKFSYVAALRGDVAPAAGRVIRHPRLRKGQVLLEVCTRDDGLRAETVSKRYGDLYRAARDADWGSVWPPADLPGPADRDVRADGTG